MQVENSIKETTVSSTVEPIKDYTKIIDVICKWNWITIEAFRDIVWSYVELWKDNNWSPIYVHNSEIIDPIWKYLKRVYEWKKIVFEKWNDKFFWTIQLRSWVNRYKLWDDIIEIPFQIRAVNGDTQEGITIFPKTSDIIQYRMENLFVVNTGWAERQRLEKEIMAKMIELSQIRSWNEIISTQSVLEELKETLARRGITLDFGIEDIMLYIPRRKVRDVAWNDDEYIAPPIELKIDFESKIVECRWYSAHGFWTPTAWGSPCWWNYDNEIHKCLANCTLKELINLLIIWAYGYNSADTGTEHEWRHPVAKLKDYIWYIYQHRTENTLAQEEARKQIKENFAEIKKTLENDNWLDSVSTEEKEYFLSLENYWNEASEQWS